MEWIIPLACVIAVLVGVLIRYHVAVRAVFCNLTIQVYNINSIEKCVPPNIIILLMKHQVLIVSNDEILCASIQTRLQNETTEVWCAASPSKASQYMAKAELCLVILDLQLPGIEMTEMVRIIRITQQSPILGLTHPLEAEVKIALLQVGVDAFLEKPVEAGLCSAQAKSLIRLYLQQNDGINRQAVVAFGSLLVIKPQFRQVFVNETVLALTRREFDLLYFLARYPNQVFSREQIFTQIWDNHFDLGGDDTVRVQINTLKKKLLAQGCSMIENIRGVGYRFVPPPIALNCDGL